MVLGAICNKPHISKNDCIHLSIVSAWTMLRGRSPLIGRRFYGGIVCVKLWLEQDQRGDAADDVADLAAPRQA